MAQIARVVVPAFPDHVTLRRVSGMDVFYSDEDRSKCLWLLSEQGERFAVRFVTFTQMRWACGGGRRVSARGELAGISSERPAWAGTAAWVVANRSCVC